MKLQLTHTEYYLIAVDDAINHPIDCMYRYIYIDNTIRRISSIQPLSGVNLIIYHLPLNNAPVLEGIELLPPLEYVEELAKQNWGNVHRTGVLGFIDGYNKAKEDYKYTEEDMEKAIEKAWLMAQEEETIYSAKEKIIKSFSKPKLPTSFDTETKQYIYEI